jgi:2-haloacid dehalogenase
MLEAGIRNSQLEGVFDHVLSTDRVRAFKPDPRAYQMGIDAFGLKREAILFAAFAGWDAAGAKSFGYPTFWVNRQNQPVEELGTAPNATGGDLNELVTFVIPVT